MGKFSLPPLNLTWGALQIVYNNYIGKHLKPHYKILKSIYRTIVLQLITIHI